MASYEKRKTKDGKTRWRAVVRKDGLIKRKTFPVKADAMEWARQTESAIAMGDAHVRQPTTAKVTVGAFIDDYLDTVQDAKPKSRRTKVQQLGWWKEQIGKVPLNRLDVALLVDQRDRLARSKGNHGRRYSPATVNRYLAAMSHVLTHAVKMGKIGQNPMRAVDRMKEPPGRTRFLSKEEKDRLLDECRNHRNPNLYLIVLIALSTGMRKGEIQGLEWNSVDLERRRLVLRETKNGEVRVVPLVGKALEELKAHRNRHFDGGSVVFPQYKDRAKSADVREAFEACVKRAGLDDFKFHDLRHTTASHLLMNGASLPEIAAVLGHKTLAMVQRYAHLSDAHTAGVVERMNRAFLG